MRNSKFTEKHLSLVIGIPIILVGTSYLILLAKYGLSDNLSIPAFYNKGTSVFLEEFINIGTGIIQFAAAISTIVISLIKFSKIWNW